MNIFIFDVVLTASVIGCFVILGAYSLQYFSRSAPNIASYSLGISHILFALSLSCRLATMLVSLPLVVGWTGRILRTLAYLYLVYAFMLVKLPCHAPLLRALACPTCALDLLEPARCKQSVLRLLFTAVVFTVVLSSVLLLGSHPDIRTMTNAPSVGYFWYSSANRLPLYYALVQLIIQAAACAGTSMLIIKTFSRAWITIVLAMSLVMNLVGYTIYIWLGFFEQDGIRNTLYYLLRSLYPLTQFAHTALYLVPVGWIMLAETHDLFDAQKREHLVAMSDRLIMYTNSFYQSVTETVRDKHD